MVGAAGGAVGAGRLDPRPVARRGATAVLGRLRGLSPAIAGLTARVVYYAILLIGIGVALSFLGAPIQPLLAVALIVAVVVALALRGISDNFAAGIVLQTRRPIDIGDLIGSDGQVGTVTELNGRSVVLRTADGLTVHLPNASVLEHALINHSAAGATRAEIEVRLDPGPAERAALTRGVHDLVAGVEGVRPEHEVRVLTVLDAPDRLVLRVRFWTAPADRAVITSAVVSALAGALRAEHRETVVTSALPVAPLTPPTAV